MSQKNLKLLVGGGKQPGGMVCRLLLLHYSSFNQSIYYVTTSFLISSTQDIREHTKVPANATTNFTKNEVSLMTVEYFPSY